MKILIKNGRVIDPANNRDGLLDILLEDTKISQVAKNIKAEAEKVIDATHKIVIPGIVDMHVHLREPGREDKENVFSGTRAALKGGVSSVLVMPNTLPAIDSPELVKQLKDIIQKTSQNNVFIAAAITKGRLGKELTDITRMRQEGIIAISDDGSSVDSQELLLSALSQAKENGILLICHSEDKALSNNGAVNSGFTSTRLGLRGISKESEYKRIERDIRLAEKIGAPIHIAHLSCRESVEIIARAKKKGLRVSCETAPHYFSLSEEDILDYDTNKKMNRPLRGKEDKSAIEQGLKEGVIDVIASDHAPHTENEKEIEFERAEFGVIGLETGLAVAISELIVPGLLDWPDLVKKISLNPAKILKVDKGTLSLGARADIAIVDPEKEWVVEESELISKSKNSAFLGRKVKGVVEYTICNGKIAYPF